MLEEEKDVKPDPSPDNVVEGADAVVPEETETTEEVTSTQEVKPEVKDSRPIENVAWETKRKLDETLPTIQRQIEELTSFVKENRQTPQEQQPSKAQLLAFASDPTTTVEQRIYAYNKVDEIDRVERQKEYEQVVRKTQRNTESESRKSQAAQWVAQTFPETTVRDGLGNVAGWNNQSPLLAKANEYMNRSENLRNDPEGFMAAVKMAAFDLGVAMGTNKKLDKTVGQLRKEQKKQLASSGGTRVTENPASTQKTRLSKLQEEYSKTGNKDVFAEIVKVRGLNPFI